MRLLLGKYGLLTSPNGHSMDPTTHCLEFSPITQTEICVTPYMEVLNPHNTVWRKEAAPEKQRWAESVRLPGSWFVCSPGRVCSTKGRADSEDRASMHLLWQNVLGDEK